MIEVHVAVAVIRRDNRILIARRPDHVHQGGLLEFPGGKVEPGETVQAALVREIAEETGLDVHEPSLQPVIGVRHDYGDKRVFLDVWETTEVLGEPEGREGQPVQWLAVTELRDEDFPAANRPIIRALRLPHQYAITGEVSLTADGLRHLERRLERMRPDMVLLRSPGLDRDEYEALANQALPLCQASGAAMMLHGSPGLLERIPGAAGVHLPWRIAREQRRRPIAGDHWLAVSCHNEAEIEHAVAIGADFVTLGPVQPTRSHPGAAALGWTAFQQLVAQAPIPVYALGGMVGDDIHRVRQAGGQGIAGISRWW